MMQGSSLRLWGLASRMGMASMALVVLSTGCGPGPSVKPGINDRWRSPEIDPLIGSLESESREIYVSRERLAAVVAPRPGSAVADVGAGSGFMSEQFARIV